MSRVLLADDSPHAQRMGERILREEGFEVASVTDGATAMIRLRDVDPDLILLDAFLPQKSGYDICSEIKQNPNLSFTSVILTFGLTEAIDNRQVSLSGADAILQKPFESGSLLELIRPLVELSKKRRNETPQIRLTVEPAKRVEPKPEHKPEARPQTIPEPIFPILQAKPAPALAVGGVKAISENAAETATIEGRGLDRFDEERVRAAVTLALDAAMPHLIDEITAKVLLALKEY